MKSIAIAVISATLAYSVSAGAQYYENGNQQQHQPQWERQIERDNYQMQQRARQQQMEMNQERRHQEMMDQQQRNNLMAPVIGLPGMRMLP